MLTCRLVFSCSLGDFCTGITSLPILVMGVRLPWGSAEVALFYFVQHGVLDLAKVNVVIR